MLRPFIASMCQFEDLHNWLLSRMLDALKPIIFVHGLTKLPLNCMLMIEVMMKVAFTRWEVMMKWWYLLGCEKWRNLGPKWN